MSDEKSITVCNEGLCTKACAILGHVHCMCVGHAAAHAEEPIRDCKGCGGQGWCSRCLGDGTEPSSPPAPTPPTDPRDTCPERPEAGSHEPMTGEGRRWCRWCRCVLRVDGAAAKACKPWCGKPGKCQDNHEGGCYGSTSASLADPCRCSPECRERGLRNVWQPESAAPAEPRPVTESVQFETWRACAATCDAETCGNRCEVRLGHPSHHRCYTHIAADARLAAQAVAEPRPEGLLDFVDALDILLDGGAVQSRHTPAQDWCDIAPADAQDRLPLFDVAVWAKREWRRKPVPAPVPPRVRELAEAYFSGGRTSIDLADAWDLSHVTAANVIADVEAGLSPAALREKYLGAGK
jgi:hypothetical protein